MVKSIRPDPQTESTQPNLQVNPGEILDDRLAIFQEVTTALNSTLDPGELLDQILDASIRYTGATTGSVALLSGDGTVLQIARARGLGADVENEVRLKVGEGITGWVAQNRQALNVPDVKEDKRYVMVKNHIRSEMAVPMVLGKRVIGVISVDSSKKDNFSDEDLRILSFVGTQAAQILQKAQAYNELRVKNAQDETLIEISQALGSALDFEELFKQVGMILESRCGMFRNFLVLKNPDTEELGIKLAHGMTEKEMARGRYTIGEGITGTVVESGEPFGVQDIRTEPRFLDKTGSSNDSEEIISFLAVPINLEGKTIGVLGALKPFPGESQFDSDMSLLQIISSTISQAVKIHFKVISDRESLIQENLLLKEELKTRYKYNNLVGNSKSMQKVFSLIGSVAKRNSTVLIRGESGTGKELIAHAIHFNSTRSEKPFVKVNCAAIPENLLETELFGHKKGAFTHAHQDRAGKFVQADGGTIFLDEIGDMSPLLQVKILRVLQEREVELVGGSETVKVDVRIIAATHRNLEEMVKTGDFREDLYYRLNVVPIEVPALRERQEDIPGLIQHFVDRFRKENNLKKLRLAPESVRLLIQYDWPGNVRQLENVIERATILCDGDLIRPIDFPEPIYEVGQLLPVPNLPENSTIRPEDHLPHIIKTAFEQETLAGGIWNEVTHRVERDLIEKALLEVGGVRLKAAEILGIHRNTLRKKIEELGIKKNAE